MELTKVKLGDYLDDFGDGIHGTPNYDENGEYYFINGNNLDNGAIFIDSETKRISSDEYESIKRNLNNRTLLLSINGTLGRLAYYNGENIALGKSACFLNFKENTDRRYFRYILEMKDFKQYMFKVASGSTIKNFSPRQAAEYEFFAPKIEDQKKIACVLSALDEKIALNKKMNQKLEAMAKRLYDYWFVQYDFPDKNGHPYKTTGGPMTYNPTLKREIPEGWEVSNICPLMEILPGGDYHGQTAFLLIQLGYLFHRGAPEFIYIFLRNHKESQFPLPAMVFQIDIEILPHAPYTIESHSVYPAEKLLQLCFLCEFHAVSLLQISFSSLESMQVVRYFPR